MFDVGCCEVSCDPGRSLGVASVVGVGLDLSSEILLVEDIDVDMDSAKAVLGEGGAWLTTLDARLLRWTLA